MAPTESSLKGWISWGGLPTPPLTTNFASNSGYQLFVLLRNSAHNVHMICFNTSDTIWASMKPFCVFFFFEQKIKENPTRNVS